MVSAYRQTYGPVGQNRDLRNKPIHQKSVKKAYKKTVSSKSDIRKTQCLDVKEWKQTFILHHKRRHLQRHKDLSIVISRYETPRRKHWEKTFWYWFWQKFLWLWHPKYRQRWENRQMGLCIIRFCESIYCTLCLDCYLLQKEASPRVTDALASIALWV